MPRRDETRRVLTWYSKDQQKRGGITLPRYVHSGTCPVRLSLDCLLDTAYPRSLSSIAVAVALMPRMNG